MSHVARLLHDLQRELVYTRISGYGQTGPKAALPGYASVCEGFGGLRCGTYWESIATTHSELSVIRNGIVAM